jgi:cell division protein FtsW (lipid II flippase)
MLALFYALYGNLSPQLARSDAAGGQRSFLLQPASDRDSFHRSLTDGAYYDDPRDADLITDSLIAALRYDGGRLANLGAINKHPFRIVVPESWQSPIGGADFQHRIEISRLNLGFDSALYLAELTSPPSYSNTEAAGSGALQISGTVRADGEPMAGVLVQLRQHVSSDTGDISDIRHYARTDSKGSYTFTGLQRDSAYSVVPLRPGFEFGGRQGRETLRRSIDCDFNAAPHTIRLIGAQEYNRIKADRIFMVRTAAEFRSRFWIIVFGFVLAFWAVELFFRLRKFRPDPFLLPLLMLLTGTSLLVLLAIQDPLQDTLFAWHTFQGMLIGLCCFALTSTVDIGRFYTRWWFDPLVNLKQRSHYNLKGWTWLAMALGLALITLVFGYGPDGSGVKVNIGIAGQSIQPSEITKYLLVFFFAGFFAANEERLRNFPDARWRFMTSWGVMIGAGALLLLYLLMGDMGPALVVCFTFLIFYSLARQNLLATLVCGIVYCALLAFLPGWVATLVAFGGTAVFLLLAGKVRSSKWYGWAAILLEAPVLLLLIIATFSFGDKLPGIGDRLGDRKQIWLSPWNNDVYGGDHLAHSYWTLSSGGVTGHGIGRGFAGTMPAAHTDMILPSIGESLGWVGLLAVLLLFAILIHRLLLHARRAGQPFSFYLCAGIAITLGVQFLLIAGGSIGLLPLTGVAVPLLSYGKISLIVNLAALGIIAGISGRPGHEVQKEYINLHYTPVLLTGIAGFLLGIICLGGRLAWIQLVAGKELIVKPARVVSRNGLPVYSYNPRIEKLSALLAAGNIYDRNHLLLATSDASLLRTKRDSLVRAGLDAGRIAAMARKRQARYYPFAEHMFFWTGDFNTRLLWGGQANGYFAEAAHLSELRGFDTRPQQNSFFTSRYREDRFSRPVVRQVSLPSYDYSQLAEMLRGGIDTAAPAIRALRAKNRDIRLSVDAGLQTELQQALGRSKYNQRRISVVVLDAGSGEVLASALHPLPDLSRPEQMLLSDRQRMALPHLVMERDPGMTYPTAPGSTAKILTASAAYNKLGLAASNLQKTVTPGEIIRSGEPTGTVTMENAIVNSSNLYFIRIANDEQLARQMGTLYMLTGMNVRFRGGYAYSDLSTDIEKEQTMQFWEKAVFRVGRERYRRSINNGGDPSARANYTNELSWLAWGQGQLAATPASMARMAGLIANNGRLQPSRYLLERQGIRMPVAEGIPAVSDSNAAKQLTSYMIRQSAGKVRGLNVAGKTGTPHRIVKQRRVSDAWYVFFAPVPGRRSCTVVCVRIEEGGASANASELASELIAPVLVRRSLMESF